ncbi:uroporphyrinogen decarboxylase (URO-D) [delta proteobacterium NaphS2]|nr:uroporphyrinogen decarboxylase (URO-D) [delta proteobacterium NaphS2]
MGNDYMRRFWSFENVERIPFLPMMYSMAARIQSISLKELLTNPTKMAIALQKAHKLFGYDGIFNVVDCTLEADACGCQLNWPGECEMPGVTSHPLEDGIAVDQLPLSDIENMGRIPAVLETTKRLQMVMGNKTDIISVLTGPLTLSQHLAGETFNKNLSDDFSEAYDVIRHANTICIRLCKCYCERKVDGILIYDTLLSKLNSETLKLVKPFYRTLFNVVDYFNIYFIIFVGSHPSETIEDIFEFDAKGIIVSGDTDLGNLADLAEKNGKCLGWAIPEAALSGTKDFLRETVLKAVPKKRRGFFLTTDGPVPYATPAENVHELMNLFQSTGP